MDIGGCIKLNITYEEIADPAFWNMSVDLKEETQPPFSTFEDVTNIISESTPNSTRKKRNWAVNHYKDWLYKRSQVDSSLPAQKPIEHLTIDELNRTIPLFILDIKDTKGQPFRGKTMFELVLCLQQHINSMLVDDIYKFLSDHRFRVIRNTLDGKMKKSAKENPNSTKSTSVDIISNEMEEKLWKEEHLKVNTPDSLITTLIFLLGLNFAIRGGSEHINLTTDNFTLVDNENEKYLQYNESTSKTNQGGIKHMKKNSKSVRAYPTQDANKDVIEVYKRYISLRPIDATNRLYLRPLCLSNSSAWFSKQHLGIHQITKRIKLLCQNAGFQGKFTAHSLRATAATRLYTSGADEQLICERTGHTSNAVRAYKRTSDEQQAAVSAVVQGEASSIIPAPKVPTTESVSKTCTITSATQMNRASASGTTYMIFGGTFSSCNFN